MGKKGSWISAVKKALSPDSKEKKDQKSHKSKKRWFGKHKDLDLVSSSAGTPGVVPTPSVPIEDVKLTEAENEQSKHAYSVAFATAVAAEAAVAAAQAAAEVVRLTTVSRYSGKSKEEVAAIKIQTAFRGYLARRALRALRGLVRLKSLIQGQSVKRQATTTLRCMQTLARVQSQIRARRIRMSEENQALQRQLQQKHDRELEKLRASMGEEWNDSTQSKEKTEAKLQNKQEAAMRRERALAYAYSHQQMWKNSSKSANPTFMDPNNPHWGWSWLERWMAARPWESRSAIDKELNSERASVKSTASRGISVGEISKSYSRRDLNLDNKPSPTAQKRSRPPSRQSPSTPPSKAPSSSSVAGKTKPPSPRGSTWGGDDDLRSMLSAQSERFRRHSIAGSSVRDDESLASSPSVPSYMAPTKSAKAKSRLTSPLGVEKNGLPLHYLQNKRVCIDLSCWIVQLQNVNKSHSSMRDKIYLRGLFHRLRALIALNCSLIFVTDGSIPAIKLSTYRRRLNSGSEVTRDESNSHKATSLPRNMGSEFSCMIKEAKALGMALGIPCLDGIEEAEAQCALLNSESLCDGCFTSDSDVFLFGGKTVYRDICLGEGGYVVCYEMADIESTLGFGRNSLITLALLLGSDYSQGVHGFGPESACHIVKSVGDDVVLKRIASEGLSFAKKPQGLRKHAQVLKCNEMNANRSEYNSQKEDQFLQVINAYLKPKCHSVDSDAVHRVLALYPFKRSKLQQICAHFFGWPPEKTDEYILPKIAERDLRRFANLRATSSDLGVRLPLHEMPVKCPISGIIKHRKVQGKECFDVSWEELDGLKSSMVPADLIESACPEKIVEFEEKKVQGKKQNHRKPRPKKSENKASMEEIDLKLQNLLLDIEVGSNSIHNSSFSLRAPISVDRTVVTAVDLANQDPLLSKKSEGDNDYFASLHSCSTGSYVAEKEVIDLLSPSPLIHNRNVSKCQQPNARHIDVIDLSESETDVSPEHARKARELRLFLVGIKDDFS